ncbi:MAG TPA: cbb3-type cytochrome c oxidase subunit I, partial [Gemmatimonadaceae bacterium]|nr:cbb3-type cytochrome c oxidase subunit I [Gemmatimonadaceae bacterium]
LGKASFWLLLVGVNVTFFPQFLLGLAGMPRRVYTYLAETGWGSLNFVSTIGAGLLTVALLLLLVNVVRSFRRGELAGADPWGGETLEWATTSPPPEYGFALIPIARGRSTLWAAGPTLDGISGLRDDRREVLQTTMLDAEPDSRHEHPDPTLAPLAAALSVGVGLVWGIFHPIGFVVGAALSLVTLTWWGWPRKEKPGTHEIVEVPE